MTMNAYQKIIFTAIKKYRAFFSSIGLNKKYTTFYFTIFTKSEEEYRDLRAESSKCFTCIDSSNGDIFEMKSGSFLPPDIHFLRIRHPDSSPIQVAGDILGTTTGDVERELQRLGIRYQTVTRPDTHMIEIVSPQSDVTIYFPEKHFLETYMGE